MQLDRIGFRSNSLLLSRTPIATIADAVGAATI